MKPMTFEEWDAQVAGPSYNRERWMGQLFKTARLGMIPEDEAVRIDWSDPKLSTRAGIVILPVSQEHISTVQDVWGAHKLYKYIPRPVPAGTPKVGDRVFGKVGEHQVIVGMVSEIPEHGRWIAVTQGSFVAPFDRGNLKPFFPEKIGLKWEEI